MADTPPPVKRGPGRPAKNQHKGNPLPINGIVTESTLPGAVVEIEYHNPRILSHIMEMIKKMKSEDVVIVFEKDKMIIKSRGRTPDIIQETTIFGEQVGKYYCSEPITLCFKRTTLGNPLEKIEANYSKIMINVMAAEKNSRMVIGLSDPNLKTIFYGVPAVIAANVVVPSPTDDPLVIKFSHADFKKQLKTQKNTSPFVRFYVDAVSRQVRLEAEKTPEGASAGGLELRTEYVQGSSDNILRCDITNGDFITASTAVTFLEPLTVASLGKDVIISISKTGGFTCSVNADMREVITTGEGASIKSVPVVVAKLFIKPLETTSFGEKK